MCVLDKEIDEGIVDGGAKMALERLFFLFCTRLVEPLEVGVIGGVGFHIGEGGGEGEGVRLGLIGEFFERSEEMEKGSGVLTERFR